MEYPRSLLRLRLSSVFKTALAIQYTHLFLSLPCSNAAHADPTQFCFKRRFGYPVHVFSRCTVHAAIIHLF